MGKNKAVPNVRQEVADVRILLDGYFDHNFGDDLMLTLAAKSLKEYELYVPDRKINLENADYTSQKTGFDAYLKVTGSGFQIYNNLGIAYRMRDMHRETRRAPMRAAVSCNISPFINRAARTAINMQLSSYDLITVRDSYSYEYIRQNVPNVRCGVYPDIVFSLPDSMIPDIKCENLLGVAVRAGADAQKIAAAIDGYTQKTGSGALLLCFDTGSENDAQAAERIKQNAKYADKIEIITYENITDMLANMRRCAVILSIRFHSIVLAARMGIPFVPFAYSDKTVNALTDLEFSGKIFRTDDFDAADVTQELLTVKRFLLPEDTAGKAKLHMEKFKELLAARMSQTS